MADHRIAWIKHVIYCNFNLQSDGIFHDFLKRDGEINRLCLERFLDNTQITSRSTVHFTIKSVRETIFEEVEIPLEPEGMHLCS